MDAVSPLGAPGIPTTEMLGIHGRDLAALHKAGESIQVREAAEGFESVFASMLLKEMQGTLESGSLFGSDPTGVYGGLFELFLGQEIGESGTLGIADLLSRYFESQNQLR
ncbi:MAG: hypothetical protein KY476_06000 [Planctomycetes bacterium]|nr:hypothetical protein [Planctomycetota bacterium]